MQRIIGKFYENNVGILLDGEPFNSFPEFEKIKESKWHELKHRTEKEKGKLWNGSIYRLSQITQSKRKCLLHLSTIDFKTHYATLFAVDLFKKNHLKKDPTVCIPVLI